MTSVNDIPQVHVHMGMLLGLALARMRDEIAAAGDSEYPGLRASHFRLLELIPDGGARITDLAEVARMTKQALGQHMNYLQERGYTESVRRPDDRRVRLVRRTPLGDRARDYSREAIDRVEQRWRGELGPARYQELAEALSEIVGPLPQSRLRAI